MSAALKSNSEMVSDAYAGTEFTQNNATSTTDKKTDSTEWNFFININRLSAKGTDEVMKRRGAIA